MRGAGVQPNQGEVAAFLADPRIHGGQPVERIDTHGAMVFLAGDRAYKLKRAVLFPYMDFSTVERRRAACEAEVRLNRRTAPNLYLAAEAVRRRPDGRLALGGAGEVVDWVVVMRRFDSAALLDRMADRGALTEALMRALAEAIAAFHDAAEPRPDQGSADAMAWVIEDNVAELRGEPGLFPVDAVDRLARRSTAALDRVRPLLERRRAAGAVRLCHGDLHLGNVCLIDGRLDGRPTLFDCIEFDDRIAAVDVLYDAAFLFMDLEHRGLRRLANVVANRYLELRDGYDGLALLPLFLSARAAVRAKTGASAAAAQGDLAWAAALRTQAADYLERALGFLAPPPPCLVAVGGLSGTGKTTLARALAAELGAAPGAVVLRSDVLRKRLLGLDEGARLGPAGYRADVTARAYATLAERARAVVSAGHAAIVDAVCANPDERAVIERAAREAGVTFRGLWLEADEATLVARVAARGDASDATPAVVRRQSGYSLGSVAWARIDARGDVVQTKHRAAAAIAGRKAPRAGGD
jgi:aminoglycoside phosphotransferase family enzyme/predicted kinase